MLQVSTTSRHLRPGACAATLRYVTSEPLALRLRRAREATGLSQEKAAQLLGAGRVQVNRWENGVYTPNPKYREAMERLYGLEPGSLTPEDYVDEEVLLLREVLGLVERLIALHVRQASRPGASEGGPAEPEAQRAPALPE